MSEFKTNKISPRKGTTQTIGDSGDTVSIPSGVTLSNAGTISGIQKIDWDTTKKTSAFTAVNQTGYFVDTTSAAITVTFPATPSAGNVIGLKDYANTFDTNNLTIDPNGNKIQGVTENFIVSDEGAALNFIYVDATRGWVLTDASKASDIAEQILYVTATGGTITTCGDYKIHTFTGPGTFCVSCAGNTAGNNSLNYLIVAGGGGSSSGRYGAGGAGGLRTLCGTLSSTGGYPVTVGAGGNGSSPGSNTIFLCSTSAGGGSLVSGIAASGGSGAGGCYYTCDPSYLGGAGNTPPVSPSQGNPGGNGAYVQCSAYAGGGGGGHTSAGSNATAPPSNAQGGPGGAGTNVSPFFPGFSLPNSGTYAGGGGGATANGLVGCGGTPGTGGTGGGGPGGTFPTPGTNGTTNTGGGGGGRNTSGGSGIVIIRYKYQN